MKKSETKRIKAKSEIEKCCGQDKREKSKIVIGEPTKEDQINLSRVVKMRWKEYKKDISRSKPFLPNFYCDTSEIRHYEEGIFHEKKIIVIPKCINDRV